MALPKFVGIGAPRCGTRWLAEALAQHPEISVINREVYFFTQRRVVHSNWNQGVRWYSNLVEDSLQPGVVTWGEITPFYLFDVETPKLMHDVVPDAKLICCLRDQSERAYSWYRLFLHFNPSLFGTDFSFRSFLTYSNEVYGREGFYLEHILRYLELFPRQSMLILLYDDLQTNPVSYIQEVYRFLGVAADFVPSASRKATNLMELHVPRSRALLKAARSVKHSNMPGKALVAGLGSRLVKANQRHIARSALPERHRLDPEMRERMSEMYGRHNEELGRFLGRDLSHWNKRK